MKRTLTLFAVLLIAALSLWLNEYFKQRPEIHAPLGENFSDYFMDNFTLTSMDKNGQPAYTLQASKLRHFANDDSLEILGPEIHFHSQKGQWQVNADKAIIEKGRTRMHLHQHVVLQRQPADSHTTDLQISTSYLQIDTQARIASTDKPARVTGPQLTLDTDGLRYEQKTGKLELLSNVRGVYDKTR